jgi:hypothetical protein
MTASRPPSAPAKRPWYLVAALVASWVYGALAVSEGYAVMTERPDVEAETDPIADPGLRQRAFEAGQHWLTLKDAARGRELPIGVAKLLLGGVMVLLVARSMAGREGARGALVQVVAVHGAVVVAGFLLGSGIIAGEIEYRSLLMQAAPRPFDDPENIALSRRILAYAVPLATLARTAFSAAIVIALTRRRTLAFFREAEPGALGEG